MLHDSKKRRAPSGGTADVHVKPPPRTNRNWRQLAMRPVSLQRKPIAGEKCGACEKEAAAGKERPAIQFESGVVLQRKPDKKKEVAATVDNVDDLYGPLTEDLAKQAFDAYGSALTGNEKGLISAFTGAGLSAWMGLAIIKQESSFANKDNNPDIDERNVANPFSVHFNTNIKNWPDGCGKNLLLIAEAGKSYTPVDEKKKACAAKNFRLPTFTESANSSAKTMAKLAKGKKGIDEYREEPGYKNDLNTRLREILKKIKAKRK